MRAKFWPFLLLLTPLVLSCKDPAPPLPRQPWIDQPPDQQPTILLTNQIRLGAMEFDAKANAFLVDTGSDTLAATCKHLFLVFENPDIQAIDFADLLKSWTFHPRPAPDSSVRAARLLNADPNEEINKRYIINRDWLLFSLVAPSPHLFPLKPRFGKLAKNKKVYLLGRGEDGLQQLIEGAIDETYDYTFTVNFGERDVGPFSGSPVIDTDGYLVGIHTGVLGNYSWVNSTRYLQEVLENSAVVE
jgi:hypothetical protein